MEARQLTPKKTSIGRRARSKGTYKLSVLFIEDSLGWSAQVLEYDIATQADTLQALFHEVERILVAYVALAHADGRQPFEGIPRAPEKYWEVFKASHISMERPPIGIKARGLRLPRIEKEIRLAEIVAA
jgi:hypothetical protein